MTKLHYDASLTNESNAGSNKITHVIENVGGPINNNKWTWVS